ncbi:MAG: 3-isopropylmalate dehydratase [Actinomycetota bacterium]|jgi:3-isopropylmalate/(R)-2-methylmalate dehydratase small subunit|nr:3-isopropylmalate dehydratase [Actinomycetota bacterium]
MISPGIDGTRFSGTAWLFGPDISTDMLSPGQYVHEPLEIRLGHVLEAARPEFASLVKPGDIVVAGANFGCGSSRESAPQHLKDLGISVIVADSLARIFARNAIALGLPALSCPGISTVVKDHESLEVDIVAGEVSVGGGRTVLQADRMPDSMLDVLRRGGIEPLLLALAAETISGPTSATAAGLGAEDGRL